MSNEIRKRRTPEGRKTPELVDELLDRIAGGESVRRICSDSHMPCRATVQNWLEKDQDLERRYALACHLRMDVLADENEELAASAAEPTLTSRNGDPMVDSARVQAIKLRIENNRWLQERLAPKRYGDQKFLTVSTGDEGELRGIMGKPLVGQAQITNARVVDPKRLGAGSSGEDEGEEASP